MSIYINQLIKSQNMKKIYLLSLLLFIALITNAQKAKYVFYFIGDGMGLNPINVTEMYLAEKEKHIGISPLTFASFPIAGYATSFSATNSVTDSSAGGTALATGIKTYNGAIGVDKNKNIIESIAAKAKKNGKKVGIATSVSIDHATPASFYAHQIDRNMYYEIALDLPKAGFDFYAGSGFLKPETTYKKEQTNSIYPIIKEAGYTIVKGTKDYNEDKDKAKKIVMIQEDGYDEKSLQYAIDRKNGDMTLHEITESAIDFLTKDNKKGFFLMIEGGKIDWALHANDVATMCHEIIDFDNAIKVAYDFYKKHPNETLIVITADHDTGGLGMGTGKYELNLKTIDYQKSSADILSMKISQLRKEKKGKVEWKDIYEILKKEFGFWDKIAINWDNEKKLRDEYENSFVKCNSHLDENMYSKTEPLATIAKEILNNEAKLAWSSSGHSGAYVPVFAIGVNAKLFQGKMDNTDIPKKICKAAGYK